ncbi:MAG: hypothetical protein WBE26_09990 [Phycisphaerae bacterium]
MNQNLNRGRRTIVHVLLSCFPLTVVGCNPEKAAEVAALSRTYLGDVATTCLQEALGVEGGHAHDDVDAHDDADSHDAGPLHNHEH